MKRKQLATTFTESEVRALDALLRAVREGKDARVLVRHPAVSSAHGKFVRMREKSGGAAS